MSKITRLTAAAAAALFTTTGAALAAEASPVTRADVVAELDTARSSGELAAMAGEDSGSIWLANQDQRVAAGSGSGTSALRTASTRAQPQGCGGAMFAEDSGSFCLALQPSTSRVTRAQVRAELLQARASGVMHAMLAEDSGSMLLSNPQPAAAIRYAGPDGGEQQQPHSAAAVQPG
jgi:hypothetical protein